ncbi:MAG: HPF/RaiA family ribosome-associated protein [Bacteroidota bacterium]
MKVNVQGIGVTPRQDLLDLINDKLNKLERISDRIVEAKVILRVEKSTDRSNKQVEVRLAIPGNDIFVKKQGESFEEVVQKTTDTLQRELKDWKEKNGH